MTHSASMDLAREREALRAEQLARLARREAARRILQEDPKTQAAITAYRIERERAMQQGKPVLRPADELGRIVP